MAHSVLCLYCKERFDRDKVECVQVQSRRYAHKKCYDENAEKIIKEEEDKIALFEYIKELFQVDFIEPRLHKQINQYVTEYRYTYSGIRKALIYFYHIKKNPIEKANGGLGIVPYIYQESFNYFFSLWEAQQKNKDKNIETYIPNVKEIIISPPQCNIRKKNLFKFLDEEYEE